MAYEYDLKKLLWTIVFGLISVKIFEFFFSLLKKWYIFRDFPQQPSSFLRFFIGDLELLGGPLFGRDKHPIKYFLKACEKVRSQHQEKYHMSLLWNFWTPEVHLMTAESTKELLESRVHVNKSTIYHINRPFLRDGLLMSGGAKWKQRRRLLNPTFHTNILKNFLIAIEEKAHEFTNSIKSGEVVDISEKTPQLTLSILLNTLLGCENLTQKEQTHYIENIEKYLQLINKRLYSTFLNIDLFYRFSENRRETIKYAKNLHDFTKNMIDKKKAERLAEGLTVEFDEEGLSRKRLALIDFLIEEHIKCEQKPVHERTLGDLDYEGIHEELDNFVFAGHDTTAVTSALFLFTIGFYPEYQEKIYQEIIEVLGDHYNEGCYNIDNLNRLKYLEQCINESMRLSPTVPFVQRTAMSNDTIIGRFIPKGTRLSVSFLALSRDENVFPKPNVFDPERFNAENMKNRDVYSYTPFAAGPRVCIGKRFAILKMMVIIAHIIRNFRIESQKKLEVFEFGFGNILTTNTTLPIKFIKR